YQPPVVWFLIVVGLAVSFLGASNRHRFVNFALLFIVACASWLGGADRNSIETVWSPYQKLVLTGADPVQYPFFRYFVTVNNSWYQGIQDLSKETTRLQPSLYPPDQYGLS